MAQELKDQRKDNEDIKQLFNDMKALREENTDLKLQITELTNKINLIETPAAVNVDSNETVDRIATEVNERKKRESNIIMYDIPESTSETSSIAYDADMNNARQYLNNINENIHIFKILRLGKRSAKPRPLKIVLKSPDDVKLVFKNRDKLPNNRVKNDYTPMQQQQLRKIYDELQQRKNNGENDIMVKFINNTPTIIKQNSNKINKEN